MALSADTNLIYEIGDRTTVPVKASAQIYVGSAVGYTAGYARALVAGDDFAGFALENKLGTTDGAVNCAVIKSGMVQLAIAAAAVTDIGKPVYASADNTFTLTQSTNSKIGTVTRWVSTGVVIVDFKAQGAGADLTGVTVLTDNGGGAAANGTIEVVTAPTAIGATLTDSTGYSGTHDDTLAATAAITTLTDSTGDSGTHDDTLADGLTTTAFVADNGGATADGTVEAMTALPLTVDLSAMTDGSADNILVAIGDTSTGNRSANIQLNFDKIGDEINTTVALVTALANNVQECVDKIQTVTTDITVQNQNDSDLGQKVIELVTREAIHAQNVSDVGQKVIELVTAQAADRTAIVALTDAVKEISTKLNEVINALK